MRWLLLVLVVTLPAEAAQAAEPACTEATLRGYSPGDGAVTVEELKEELVEPPAEPRQAKVACELKETEAQCDGRARREVLKKNPTWTISETRLRGVPAGYEALLEVDGAPRTLHIPTFEAVQEAIEKLKDDKHQVILLKMHQIDRPESRWIDVTARAPGPRKSQRRRLRMRLHWEATSKDHTAVASAQRRAERAGIALTLFERRDDGSFTVVAACP